MNIYIYVYKHVYIYICGYVRVMYTDCSLYIYRLRNLCIMQKVCICINVYIYTFVYIHVCMNLMVIVCMCLYAISISIYYRQMNKWKDTWDFALGFGLGFMAD